MLTLNHHLISFVTPVCLPLLISTAETLGWPVPIRRGFRVVLLGAILIICWLDGDVESVRKNICRVSIISDTSLENVTLYELCGRTSTTWPTPANLDRRIDPKRFIIFVSIRSKQKQKHNAAGEHPGSE